MASIVKNEKGFKVVKIYSHELQQAVGSPCICDNCLEMPEEGYYIAVLNRCYYLDIVAKALAHIGAGVINITTNDPFGMTEFVFDGIKIGLMRFYNSEGEGFNAEVELKENGDKV